MRVAIGKASLSLRSRNTGLLKTALTEGHLIVGAPTDSKSRSICLGFRLKSRYRQPGAPGPIKPRVSITAPRGPQSHRSNNYNY